MASNTLNYNLKKPDYTELIDIKDINDNMDRIDVEIKKASINFDGTLPVLNGGTGTTSLTSGAALIGNGTGAIQTRTISSDIGSNANSSNLITQGAVYSALQSSGSKNWTQTVLVDEVYAYPPVTSKSYNISNLKTFDIVYITVGGGVIGSQIPGGFLNHTETFFPKITNKNEYELEVGLSKYAFWPHTTLVTSSYGDFAEMPNNVRSRISLRDSYVDCFIDGRINESHGSNGNGIKSVKIIGITI